MAVRHFALWVGFSSLAIGLAACMGGCMVGFDREFDFDGDGVGGLSDCDDSDASIHPGAEEVCGDGLDQDCDVSDSACPATEDDSSRAEPTPSPTPEDNDDDDGDKKDDGEGESVGPTTGNGNGNGNNGNGNSNGNSGLHLGG